MEGLHCPMHRPMDCGYQAREHGLAISSCRTIEVDVTLGHLSKGGGGARLSGRVIHFGVDCPGLLWIGYFVEVPALIGRAYPIL
jgi:hypothetical protein